jgi:hypothetical protein
MSNFIIDCINGDALLSEIHDYIDVWHESDSPLELYAYLGMTEKEYALFVEDEAYLGLIVTAHKDGKTIEDIIKSHLALVARSNDQSKSERLGRLIQREGLWD